MARFRSFPHAFRGIGWMINTQGNAQVHVLAAALITAMGFWLRISSWEWCCILICMAMVLAAEAVNTAIEQLTDLVSPEHHPLAGRAKDVAAGAVLICVMFGALVWGIVFVPKLYLYALRLF